MEKHKRHRLIVLVSALLFIVCLWIGFFLASHKDLWGDEVYTLLTSVEPRSYSDILSTRNIGDINKFPLFYFTQKLVCNLTGYVSPEDIRHIVERKEYIPGHYFDPYSQIILRINPVFFVSLAIVLIFYYFSRFYSFWAGAYSFLVSLSSYMVMVYWAEARPYPLWFFLSVVQTLVVLRLIQEGKPKIVLWHFLILTHCLLSLTIVLSIVQIWIVSFYLWIFLERKWKRYILLTVLPSFFWLVFYLKSGRHQFWFWHGVWELVAANLPADRIFIILVFSLALLADWYRKKTSRPRIFQNDLAKEGGYYFIYTALVIVATFVILFGFRLISVENTLPMAARYFIFLTAVGIIGTTLFSVLLFRGLQGKKWLQGMLVVFLAFLLIFRFCRSMHNAVIYFPDFYAAYNERHINLSDPIEMLLRK